MYRTHCILILAKSEVKSYSRVNSTPNCVHLFSAWVGSIGFSSLCFFGPLAGVMCDRFGCRLVTIVGSLLCSIGLLLTSMVTSIYSMYFTYGLVFGFGSCLAYTPALVVICKYFVRRRALVTGIATAGGSAGVLIMGPVLRYLIDAIGTSQLTGQILIFEL